MTNTDPVGFDPERTGEMRIPVPAQPVRPLADALTAIRRDVDRVSGPALFYRHSNGQAETWVDHVAPVLADDSPDDRLRELVLARALLVHALRLVDRELNA